MKLKHELVTFCQLTRTKTRKRGLHHLRGSHYQLRREEEGRGLNQQIENSIAFLLPKQNSKIENKLTIKITNALPFHFLCRTGGKSTFENGKPEDAHSH